MRHLIALLSTLLLSASAFAADEPPATLDPVEVNVAYKRELLVHVVELGLARGRSDRDEDLDKIACVRDKRPGTRFPQVRCATNRDWKTLANISYARATVGTTVRPKSCGSQCAYSVLSMFRGTQTKGNTTELAGGVLEISPNMLLGQGKPMTLEERSARVSELIGTLAIAKTTDEFNTSPAEVARFAKLQLVVESATDDAAERAIAEAGYTVDQYNELVERYQSHPRFRQRVTLAAVAQDTSLAF